MGFAGGKEWGWGVGRRPWREQFPEKTGGEGEEERQGLGYHGFAVTRNRIRMGRGIVIKPGGHP